MLLFLLDRCQILIGQITIDADVGRALCDLHALVTDCPATLEAPSQLILAAVLMRFLGRVAASIGSVDQATFASEFASLASLTYSPIKWRSGFLQLVSHCIAAEAAHPASRRLAASGKTAVGRILDLIEERHTDPELGLRDAAMAIRRSVWYTSRLLKQETGTSFTTHIRRRRVVTAQDLLLRSLLTQKEIALAAGFGDATQLSRQFKRIAGVTPTMFRQGLAGQRLASLPRCGS